MSTPTTILERETSSHSGQLASTLSVPLPMFDQHVLEEALLINHRQFNGIPLSHQEVLDAIQEYRKFWQAHKLAGAPDIFEVPSLLIDRVWHTHICETEQYAQDCQAYFGKFFHHASRLCDGGAENGDW